ncbi:low molecular weight protein arginine phosphatase [Bacillus sp. V59.32b]|uniref:low molecular weight protein arginine phosphatase n=1 Tax=Bacillus sp. V59.32b TaxID=1758642 RepID=UPI000E3CA268|nr:low molecular weight protein arginine phosphatase [Bacillus sp. V59.32b]RFU64264.1 low molecular weight protein arginine phosphatase [Bacillus sp. V59.32b]
MIKVLFVCTGNTCRSPMAEAILRSKNIPGIEVKSAGVFAAAGQGASPYAKDVLTKNSMTHNHISTPLTEREINWATHIFTMTEYHKWMIMDSYPRALDKTFTLKEFIFADIKDRDVSDPFGGSQNIYNETFRELSDLIDQLIDKLRL